MLSVIILQKKKSSGTVLSLVDFLKIIIQLYMIENYLLLPHLSPK